MEGGGEVSVFDSMKPLDTRPARAGWAPGGYFCKCRNCQCRFIGDKRSYSCADCAYKVGKASDTPETRLDQLFLTAFETNEAAMLDWVRIKFQIKALRDHAERLAEAARKKFENDLQAEEELWFHQNEPSGDHESVMRQWHESSDYNDFIDEWENINQALTLYRAENPKP